MDRRFIETTKFPIELVNEKSGGEKQVGGKPPFWEMVFWWTRKPLIGARAVIAASLLPEDISVDEFKRITRLNEKTPHRHNPSISEKWIKYFEGRKMLDPFAGFGSIPLEGLRLGLDVTASELLPTAYIFLKAVLEYPLKYGNKLVEDVKRWGEWVTERLKEDEDIKELYDGDVAVYIGTWEVKCPHCGKWTPLVGNWWLARVKNNSRKYKRLAYMDYGKGKDEIEIKVVDLNKEVKKNVKGRLADAIANAKVDKGKGEIVVNGTTYKVPPPNLDSQGEQATCLNCGSLIKFVDADGNHYTDKKDVAKDERNELEWYVKWALKKYHEGDESYARQRLLVKVKVENEDLVFEPCNKKDNEKLEKAKEKIKSLLTRKDPDIPLEIIPPYGSLLFGALQIVGFGMTQWYKLFNPRQLLTLVKLVKLIREVGKKVEEEKMKEGWNEEDLKNYAEGVVTYLSIGFVNFLLRNSIVSPYYSATMMMGFVEKALTFRGIAMIWNFGELFPFNPYIGGSIVRTLSGIQRALIYLCQNLNLQNQQKLHEKNYSLNLNILIDDATTLSKINDKFDIIVTDPPYSIDVPYAELSDFYYVWLKRALSDIKNGKLVPRFHPDAFFKKIGDKYVEIKTQWQEFAKREVSEFYARYNDDSIDRKEKAAQHFQNLLTQSFIAMREHLKEDGLLVTYYAHTSPEAWASLLEAGWKGAKATITNAFPIVTESAQRVTAREKLALDTSIIVVWRVGEQERERNIIDLREEIIESTKNRAKELLDQGYVGRDVLIGAMAAALNIVTRHRGIYDAKGDLDVSRLLKEYVYPFTAMGIAKSLKEITKAGEIKSSEALFYLLIKALFGSKEEMIAKKMDRNDVTLLQISTRIDANKLKADNIIKEIKDKEGKVKEITLQEPTDEDISLLERFLKDERKINLGKPKIRNSLDVLHLMEYYSMIFPLSKLKERWEEIKDEYPAEAEEAFTLADILCQILPKVDAERKLAGEFVGKIKGERLEV